MSSCLMVAAQFYGRPQDRVYHVLVSPEFEGNTDFFYPPRKPVPLELKNKNGETYVKQTKYAKITLIPIPFVSIRQQISDNLLNGPKDPATLLLSLVKEEPYSLTVDLVQVKLIYKNRELDMMPARLALYALFALQKHHCKKPVTTCRGCTECYLEVQEVFNRTQDIANLYRQVAGTRPFEEMSDSGITALNKQNFQSYKSKIRDDLKRGFGLYALPELAIEPVGKKPDTRYGIRIDKERIRIVL